MFEGKRFEIKELGMFIIKRAATSSLRIQKLRLSHQLILLLVLNRLQFIIQLNAN